MIRTLVIYLSLILPFIFMRFFLGKNERRYIFDFYIWGVTACLLSGLLIDELRNIPAITTFNMDVTIAPIIEEALKILPLFIIFLQRNKNGLSLIYVGAAIGTGFSVLDNLTYLMTLPSFSFSAIDYLLARIVSVCLMNSLTVVIIGLGVEWLRHYDKPMYSAFFGLYCFAIVYHSLFNVLMVSNYYMISALACIVIYVCGIVLLLPRFRQMQ